MDFTSNTIEDLTMSWLPNSEEMLKLTLNSNNLFYYPNSSNADYKVFDFTSHKAVDNEDEFYSTDQKQSGIKAKSKTSKKTTTASTAVKKNIYSKTNQSQGSKLKVTQTIQIPSDWKSVIEFNKQSLDKLRVDGEPEVEDIALSGSLFGISDDYSKEQVNSLNPVQAQRFEEYKFFDNITTSEDERLLRGTENGANVFITERILSVIMTMVYNSRPWHIKITKKGGNIYFDSMPDSEIDLITVNESAEEMPADDNEKAGINSFQNLSIEATLINEFIKEQILDPEEPYQEEEDPREGHPFSSDNTENLEHSAYRYRLWKVGDFDVFIRAQVHAFSYDENGNPIFVNIYALNEFNVTY